MGAQKLSPPKVVCPPEIIKIEMSTITKAPKNRLSWVDQMKGIAILAIVLFHFFQNYPDQINLVAALNRTGAKLGYAAVDIFFIMAGFNISYVIALRAVNPKWKAWLNKRLSRLYPTYFLAVLCSLLLYIGLMHKNISLDLDFVLSFLGLAGYHFQSINPGFWFFTVILQAYLLTPLLLSICQKKPESLLVLGLIVGAATKIACFASKENLPLYLFFLQTNFLGSYIFQFCLGLYWGMIFAKHQRLRKIDWLVSSSLFGIGLAIYVAMSLKGTDIVYMLGFDMLFAPLMFIGLYKILAFGSEVNLFKKLLAPLAIAGIYSYQIYLIHQPLMFSTFPYLIKGIELPVYAQLVVIFLVLMSLLAIYVLGFTNLETFLRNKFETVIAKPTK